jgi:carboxypeptidase PM20D1
VVNIRVHPSDRVDDAIVHVTRVLQEERIAVRRVGEPPTEPSGVSPTDDPAFHLLQRTVAEVFPEAVVAPGLVVGATDSRHYRALTERIYRFLPVPITSGDTLRIHGSDERVAIQDYGRAVAFYERLIRAGSGSDEIR